MTKNAGISTMVGSMRVNSSAKSEKVLSGNRNRA